MMTRPSQVTTSTSSSSSSSSKNRPTPTGDVFPMKLYRLLDDASNDPEFAETVVSWSPDGKSFKVHDKERFSTEVMPKYFGSLKYRSFQKNLNMWGFKAARRGECMHRLFVRGSESLLQQMKRLPVSSRLLLKQQQQQERQQQQQATTIKTNVLQNDNELPPASEVLQKVQQPSTLAASSGTGSAASFASLRQVGSSSSSQATLDYLRRRSSFLGSNPARIAERSSLSLSSALYPTVTTRKNGLTISPNRQQVVELRAAAPSSSTTTRNLLGAANTVADATSIVNAAATLKLFLQKEEEQQQRALLLRQQAEEEARLSKLRTWTKIAILSELQKLDDVMLSATTTTGTIEMMAATTTM